MLWLVAVAFSAGHLSEYWCQSAIRRKNTFFSCGSSCCAVDSHSEPGHWPARRMSCFYRYFYILLFPLGQEYKGGYPIPVLYKCNGRKGRMSRNPGRNSPLLFYMQQDIAIYNVNAWNRIPSKPYGNRPGIQVFHRDRSGWNPEWIWALQSAGSNRRFCGAKRTRCGASGLNL